MKLDPTDMPELIDEIDGLVKQNNLQKSFVKVPQSFVPQFLNDGYQVEATIPLYFGMEDGCFLGKFYDQERAKEHHQEQVDENLKLALAITPQDHPPKEVPSKFKLLQLGHEHIDQLVELYSRVFETYPFPIHDSNYLKKTMQTHVDYFGIFEGTQLVAAASSEKDRENGVAELTDFATLPEYRGKGFALNLLMEMEKKILKQDINLGMTIARANSAGMNITFAKAGYSFGGTLVNNTNISGKIESMNVWYKDL